MEKKCLIICILIVLTILFAGCTAESRFVGTWQTTPIAGVSFGLSFLENNTIEVEGTSTSIGTWEVDEEKLIISVPMNVDSIQISGTFTYEFQNNDQILVLSSQAVSFELMKK